MTVAGTSSALTIQMAVVALGMTSLLHLASTWFEWLRWAGVAYLVWLGVQRWRADVAAGEDASAQAVSTKLLYWQGFLVALANPKTLFFFAAFFPQFVDPGNPAAPQLVLLSATFLALATLLDGGYAILGGRGRGFLGDARRARLRNRLAGSFLVGAGLGLALVRRS